MSVLLNIVMICFTLMCALAWGQEPQVTALGFQAWKEQQVLEAQNQTLRNSSRISQLRANKPAGKESKEATGSLSNSRIKKAPEQDTLAGAERDLKRAQETLENANELQFEDYIVIYLPTLQDQPEALSKLADKLSKDELAEIFKVMYTKGARGSDAKRNNFSSLEGSASLGRGKGL